MQDLRLLIVDDSAMYRQALKDIVETIPGVQCIGEACNGKEAMDIIASEKPDVVTLDMEMPVMSGMDVIKVVTGKKINTKLIIVSACSQSGAEEAINALKLGAYDFITKPNKLESGGVKNNICRQLTEKLEALSCGLIPAGVANNKTGNKQHPLLTNKAGLGINTMVLMKQKITAPRAVSNLSLSPKAIVMGCSTGGPKALLRLFSGLQRKLEVPIFIVQHMPPMFTNSLAKSINKISAVSVKEAEDGDKPLPNHAYIAPGGRQMKLVQGDFGIEIKITDEEPDNYCKPSVDYFFSSVAEVYKSGSLGIILSGMGSDGSVGLRKMKHYGVRVLGQDEESCIVYGMPRVAQEEGLVDQQVGIERMAYAIENALMPSERNKMFMLSTEKISAR